MAAQLNSRPAARWLPIAALAMLLPFAAPALRQAAGDELAIDAPAEEPDVYYAGVVYEGVDIAGALMEDDYAKPAAYAEAPGTAEGEVPVQVASEQVYPEQPGEPAPTETLAERQIFRPITELTADATLPKGLLPDQVERESPNAATDELPETGDPRLAGGWDEQAYFWSATRFCHGPLYFEEVNLERYGYQCHPVVQPFVSGAHFFLTVPTLPYQMTVHPPRECIYTLGHYRPGSRVPWQRSRLPWDARAAAVQAGVTVGLVFLIP
jgi:hypothetical protein